MNTPTLNLSQSSFRRGRRNENFFGVKVNGEFEFADKIKAAMDAGSARAMSLGAFYVMDDARKSIKDQGKKGDPAKPGRPPKSVLGYLKQFIDFAYDKSANNAVIGPRGLDKPFSAKVAPKALEEGGPTVGYFSEGTWIDDATDKPLFGAALRERLKARAGRKSKVENEPMHQLQRGRKIALTIQAHPFMQPALQKNLPKISKLWRNSINA